MKQTIVAAALALSVPAFGQEGPQQEGPWEWPVIILGAVSNVAGKDRAVVQFHQDPPIVMRLHFPDQSSCTSYRANNTSITNGFTGFLGPLLGHVVGFSLECHQTRKE